ncbi:unnamed protein product [Spirodela intermedia]|uniref:Uncharacterized protein n=1 Tax=Spirodela intermedia TaxID=51605 RepID=A0A7I8JHE1_SPIIN|nr:unnamed protein product [Spirodela intermedia]CAA6669567.1 unnamed protein product [Spirodela intermedia]
MAANQQRKRVIGFVERLSKDILVRRAAELNQPEVHTSSYDKNHEEHIRPALVPDDVIQPHSTTSWGPHPATGVFGPSDRNHHPDSSTASAGNGGAASVLDQKAWFRPLEDVEKPPPLA